MSSYSAVVIICTTWLNITKLYFLQLGVLCDSYKKWSFPRTTSRGQSLSRRLCVLYEAGTDVLNAIWMDFRPEVPCHGSGGRSPASRIGSLASIPGQLVCDMWCTKWHWSRFPSQHFSVSLSVSCQQCPILIHRHAALSRRTNGRGLGTFQNQCSLRYQRAMESKVMSLFKPEVMTVSSFRLSNRTWT